MCRAQLSGRQGGIDAHEEASASGMAEVFPKDVSRAPTDLELHLIADHDATQMYGDVHKWLV